MTCRCSQWKLMPDGHHSKRCFDDEGRICAEARVYRQHLGRVTYHFNVWAVGASGKRSEDTSGFSHTRTVSDAKDEADKALARVRADVGFSGLCRTRR